MFTSLPKFFAPRFETKTKAQLTKFAKEEDGVVTAFALFMVLMMCLVGGIGVDLMRNEMERTNVQNTLDRAVLAAADMQQTLPPEQVVLDYFAKAGLSDYIDSADVSVTDTANIRTVSALARGTTPNMFMSVMGRDTLPIGARSTASEGVSNIEISLVLDISGSMGGSKEREMRRAAKEFVDIILTEENENTMSISLVPYNGKVNAGSLVADYFQFTTQHTFSNCVRFSDAQFNIPGPWSNDRDALKTHIDGLGAGGWTAIDLGMKWATILLDPSSQDELSSMSNDGHVDGVFLGRPMNYNATGPDATMKVVVMMTDGANTRQYDLKPPFKSGNSEIFVYTDTTLPVADRKEHFSVYIQERDQYYWIDADTTDGLDVSGWYDAPQGGDSARNMSNVELFANYPASRIADEFYRNIGYGRRATMSQTVEQYGNQTSADTNLRNICNAAKNNRVIVFAVGFEAPEGGRAALKNCASTDTHYFDAQGAELSEKFAAIARTITQLKLTQ